MNYHEHADDVDDEEEEEEVDTKALRQRRIKDKFKRDKYKGDCEQRIRLKTKRPRQSISWDPECDEEDYEQYYNK